MLKQFLAKISWPFRFRLNASLDFGYRQGNYNTPVSGNYIALEHAMRQAEPLTPASTIVTAAREYQAFLDESK